MGEQTNTKNDFIQVKQKSYACCKFWYTNILLRKIQPACNNAYMIAVYLQINVWLCNVINSWTNSSCLPLNRLNNLIAGNKQKIEKEKFKIILPLAGNQTWRGSSWSRWQTNVLWCFDWFRRYFDISTQGWKDINTVLELDIIVWSYLSQADGS